MKRTKEEATQLISTAKDYINRLWKTQGKEFKFLSAGSAVNLIETDGVNKNLEENYKIEGVVLQAPDGTRLPKTLEQIIDHFQKEDEINPQSEPDTLES